ncbi:radical SAM protein [Spongiactinospora sp. TRM90649]|uniref:radical SAM protein n=1 Tax=Spongiactinospora sp. TRM90649 TaxID=3031114 RepID=UPI0023FA3336|nr:radical SAM protein [Spongiactinospora sp. TRM90649]MDF5756691.1 radical SAM protein [Spongiactinospora sp. TRM90649]
MRWDAPPLVAASDGPSAPPLPRGAVVRAGPEGTSFVEVQARTLLERVGRDTEPLEEWGISPYRGCASACRYCSGRGAHRRLGMDAGESFETRIVVRPNAVRRLRVELAAPGWRGEPVAVGVGGDCYQPAEERYRLMPGLLGVLAEARNPFTVYTKRPLVARDADLLAQAAGEAGGRVAMSIAFVDEQVRRAVEPGAPSPQRRLEVIAALAARGVPCAVTMAPILPCLTDGADQLEATVRRIAASGATEVLPLVLRLPPGAREWFWAWVGERHPRLLPRYAELYAGGPDADPAYRERIITQVRRLAAAFGLRDAGPLVPAPRPRAHQLALV